MVQIIVGDPGSGKTKQMISLANEAVEKTNGTIIYIDATSKHMNQLDRQVRFVSMEDFKLNTYEHLMGFIFGLNSANYDIQEIYIDGMIKTIIDGYKRLPEFLEELDEISKEFDVDITISCTVTEEDILKSIEKYILK